MWPYVDSAVSDIGLQRLDKALKERRARWMLDVAVEQCVLGHACTPYQSNELSQSAAASGFDVHSSADAPCKRGIGRLFITFFTEEDCADLRWARQRSRSADRQRCIPLQHAAPMQSIGHYGNTQFLQKLEGRLRRFALGTRAPQVSGVKVVRSAATGSADADDVALDVEFIWGGNPVSASAA